MGEKNQISYRHAIRLARQSLEKGDKHIARNWAQQAAQMEPGQEKPWLILAATSTPKQSVVYLNKALKVNPESRRARKSMQWVVKHIRENASGKDASKTALIRTQKIKPKDTHPPKPSRKRVIKNHTRKYGDTHWVVALFIPIVVIGLALFYWFGLPLLTVQAAKSIAAPRPEGALMKPTLSSTTTSLPTHTPTPAPNQQPAFTPFVNISYASYFAHSWDIPEKVASNSDFWIEVDLSEQMVYAYEGSILLNSFAVSTGTKAYPTVTGTFKIYAKYPYYTMRGPGYFLPNVPYSMFFYKGYSLHGTYWHHNFGTPMSHGCVNMETSAAAWLYDQIHLGTKIFVHN